jgi:hypothetical protein
MSLAAMGISLPAAAVEGEPVGADPAAGLPQDLGRGRNLRAVARGVVQLARALWTHAAAGAANWMAALR